MRNYWFEGLILAQQDSWVDDGFGMQSCEGTHLPCTSGWSTCRESILRFLLSTLSQQVIAKFYGFYTPRRKYDPMVNPVAGAFEAALTQKQPGTQQQIGQNETRKFQPTC